MDKRKVREYYTQDKISNAILKNSKDREVAGALWSGNYDKRPNIIQYKSDIENMVNKGVTSFHFSVEHWKNAMQLDNKEYEKLRKGWDLIIDLDSNIGIPAAKQAALLIVKLFERYGIKNYGIKFSGSRGFHLCLPWNMFPDEIDYEPLAKQYPKIPRILAGFIENKIKDDLMKRLIEMKGAKNLINLLDEPPEELNPFYFVDLEKDWGKRHTFRAPFSFNEKTWFISQPLTKQKLKNFGTDLVKPKKANPNIEFIKKCKKEEAMDLLMDALDWHALQKKEPKIKKKSNKKINYKKKVPKKLFPPCIKNILAGLKDGRKRSLFTLINFLRMMNWSQKEIVETVKDWNNKKNPKSLPSTIIIGQLRYHLSRETLPANCEGNGKKNNRTFYGFICEPDSTCKKIRNPLTYPFKKMKPKNKEKVPKTQFKCEVCNKGFDTMRGLNMHHSRMHKNRVETTSKENSD